jgi:Flp pilus assembly pilin Flp
MGVRAMQRFLSLVRRFGRDESGVFAVLFGLMAIVLVALGGASVDFIALQQARNQSQIALDAAALALQPEIHDPTVTAESIRKRAEDVVLHQIADPRIVATIDTPIIDRDAGRLFLSGSFTMPTMFVSLVGVNQLGAAIAAEAMKGSVNLEVSLALDITGSMNASTASGGTRISALREAAIELVDVILQSNQGDTTAKIALVPYSQAVNAGSYATTLRGPIRAAKPISDISWATGPTRSISSATNATPVRITTSNNHGFQNGDWVYVWGMNGLNHIDNKPYRVQNRTPNTFELSGTWASWSNYGSGGSVVECRASDCDAVVTSNNHGFSNDEYVYLSGIGGMTALNDRTLRARDVTSNTLVLDDFTIGGGGSYQSGTGTMDCTWQNTTEGCRYYYFQTQSGWWRTIRVTSCVTERAANPFNDQPPSVSYVGRNYPPAGDCPDSPIIPLTMDEDALVDVIEDFSADGTTSGSLGLLWSWYMLSPNFGYAWPVGQRPEPYDTNDLLKAAIIMTDGEFNTVHFDGVLSANSNIGNSYSRHENNAHNGLPYDQARRYCDAMELAGITVYTVGFDIGTGTAAADMMTYCASEPENYYSVTDGEDLKEAFRQIARNISALRLTQ